MIVMMVVNFSQNEPDVIYNSVIIGLFILLGLTTIWTALIWKVIVEEKRIVFRNSFAQTKIILYQDIEKAQFKRFFGEPMPSVSKLTLYSKKGKKLLTVTDENRDFWEFKKRLEQESVNFE